MLFNGRAIGSCRYARLAALSAKADTRLFAQLLPFGNTRAIHKTYTTIGRYFVMKSIYILPFALILIFSSACSKRDVPDIPASMKNTDYWAIADWCRSEMKPQLSPQEWANGNNKFGMKFLRTTKGNTVISPYSIERALGMVLDGACNTTADEMLATLELPNAKQLSLSGSEVEKAMKRINSNTSVEIENSIWPHVSMTLPDDYLARLITGYQTKIIPLDYKTNPDGARTTINDAVAKSTHNRITDLLPEKSITDETRLVLTNAAYFKSKWWHTFDEKQTKPGNFYNSDNMIETPIMHNTELGNSVCIGNDYVIYDKYFESAKEQDISENKIDLTQIGVGNYIFRIILPTIDKDHPMEDRMKQLETVENQLMTDIVPSCKDTRFDEINLSLPKFKLEPDSLSIKNTLKSMGMKRAFNQHEAEFYAMLNLTPAPSDKSPYLYVDEVYHKAFIEINEDGGEAAAATAVVMEPAESVEEPSPPPTTYDFNVDHPFLFMIIEQSTGAILFMGRVTDL